MLIIEQLTDYYNDSPDYNSRFFLFSFFTSHQHNFVFKIQNIFFIHTAFKISYVTYAFHWCQKLKNAFFRPVISVFPKSNTVYLIVYICLFSYFMRQKIYSLFTSTSSFSLHIFS